ncbi:MAG: hypothetical protein KatS3mg109_1936 [Pirellulaceae bacterium]|nr:MAG: hypothetical protein KatS3mg109_1936 [Pirellulaceae bacterium]
MFHARRRALFAAAVVFAIGCNSQQSNPERAPNKQQPVAMNDHELSLTLTPEIDDRLHKEAEQLGMSREERVQELLKYGIASAENLEPGFIPKRLEELKQFVSQIPGVDVISISEPDESRSWVKLKIDINSKTAWHVVQNLAYVLNELSVTETLPTTFKPTSPPPYLNGGPDEFLFWVIEADIPFLDPSAITAYLKQRLPDPVTDEKAWLTE